MSSSVHPRLLANQLIVQELLRQRREVPLQELSYSEALNVALFSCDQLDVDDIIKAEIRALIVSMRRPTEAG